jgi:imidazolonepropionase-like amidohydrolase
MVEIPVWSHAEGYEGALFSVKADVDVIIHGQELNRIIDNLKNAKEKGIRITVGSDSFCSSLTPYGKYTITEMYALNNAGFSEMEAIVTATKNGAEMLRIDDITGTLEADKFADILVLDENPLDDIKNLNSDNMKMIMKEGKFVKRN